MLSYHSLTFDFEVLGIITVGDAFGALYTSSSLSVANLERLKLKRCRRCRVTFISMDDWMRVVISEHVTVFVYFPHHINIQIPLI